MVGVELNDESIHRGESAQRVRGGPHTSKPPKKMEIRLEKNTSKSHDTPRSFPHPKSPSVSSSSLLSLLQLSILPSFSSVLPSVALILRIVPSFSGFFSFDLFCSPGTCTADKCVKLVMFFPSLLLGKIKNSLQGIGRTS